MKKKIYRNAVRTIGIFVLTAALFFARAVVPVRATIGNVSTFIYSNDYFSYDSSTARTLANKFEWQDKSTRLTARPDSVYALQQELKNSESLYISTHGQPSGSTLYLVEGSRYFKAADVPKKMSCKLAYINACYGAKTNVYTGENLCKQLVNNGYEVAVGFTEAVEVGEGNDFAESFYAKLVVEKSTYQEAFDKAVEMTERWHEGSTASSSARIYGNVNAKLID